MKYTSFYVYQRKTSKGTSKWVAKLRWKEEGRYRETIKTLPATVRSKSAAQRAAVEWMGEMEGRPGGLRGGKTTLAECFAAWLEDLEVRHRVEGSTLYGYQGVARQILRMDGLAQMEVKRLTEDDVCAMEKELFARGLAPRTVEKYHRELKQLLGFAVRKKLIATNPMAELEAPKPARRDSNTLRKPERDRLLAFLEDRKPTELITGIWLALFGGMREGEACGLRWRSFDLDARILLHREAIGRKGGKEYLKATKTRKGDRLTVMPKRLIPHLERWREHCEERCRRCGVAFTEDLFVLGHPDGSWFSPSKLSKDWKVLAETLDLVGSKGRRPVFNDLRHTFATVGVTNGANVKSLASYLGHDPAMTLNVYADDDIEGKYKLADIIDAAM